MSKTLLLADDSTTIQRVVELTFAQEDIRVVSVGDGEQAMKAIGREAPDIVVADVGMPRVDGYDVSSHVKNSPALQHIPVLLLAGAFEPVDEDRARAAQCDGILIKPFEPRQLVLRVQELIKEAAIRRAQAAEAAAAPPAPNGHATPEEPAHTVPAWYRPEPASSVTMPPAPVNETASLDASLSSLPPAPAPGATPVMAPAAAHVPAPSPVVVPMAAAPVAVPPPVVEAPAAVPPISLDLASFDPMSGVQPEPLDWSTHTPAGSLELQAVPAHFGPVPTGPGAGAPPIGSVPQPAAPQPPEKVSLSTAFSALLAAEQTHGGAEGAGGITDAALEEMIRRMLLRVTDEVVRKVVLDAAERMVKEEIDKIKASADPAHGPEPETK
jgi:CheY-like chemotaxis protein